MAELLKNKYNYNSLTALTKKIKAVEPSFSDSDFINDVLDETGEQLALKNRMRKITINLRKHLPTSYPEALIVLNKVAMAYNVGSNDFVLLCFSDFVEMYGQDVQYGDVSIAALEKFTQYFTAEFAVRPFIVNNENLMMQQMKQGTKHESEHVRRLASEGCRPQLPGGQTLISFKKNPLPVIEILAELKADSSLYVRKSVANNLNDISKTHPELVIKIAQEGYGENSDTNGIIKHGCRTLLKKGNRDILDLLGFSKSNVVTIKDFTINSKVIALNEMITFSFTVQAKQNAKIRLEYGIDFLKANRKKTRKIFQIAQLFLLANDSKVYQKKHLLVDRTTRKHYLGTHALTLIVNGVPGITEDFELIDNK